MNEIVAGTKRWRITSAASRTVWAFMLLELARNASMDTYEGSVIVVPPEGTSNATELARWYVENYYNALWRVSIVVENGDNRTTKVWEGNAKCFYPVN